ncbi:hypothetical protein ACFL6H_00670 [Candidatus Latescibacterota bacterium]
MKKILIIVLLAVVSTGSSGAENSVPADLDILTGLFSKGIKKIIKSYAPRSLEKSAEKAFVSYSHGIELSGKTKAYFESVLTEYGLSVTNDRNKADYTFAVAVTSARVILISKGDDFERTVQINVRLKSVHSNGNVLFADSSSETYSDSITKKSARSTNNTGSFSKGLNRQVIMGRFNRSRFASLIVICGILAYFAFE